jgi:hypothetical protein
VAAGQSQRFYSGSGVGIFNWHYPSSPPQIPRHSRCPLESRRVGSCTLHFSPFVSSWTPGVFYTYFYNHAHRLRLEKLLYISRVSLLKWPHGGFRIETAVTKPFSEVKRLQIYSGYMYWPFPNGHKCPFGCNGYVTAVAAGQSQRFYSGVGIFNWYYLSSPPQILLVPVVHLETRGLTS